MKTRLKHTCLALCLGLLFSYLLFGEIPFVPEASRVVWLRFFDSGHLFLFGAMAVIVRLQSALSDFRRVSRNILLLIAIAGLVELVQPLVARSATVTDFLNSLAGICLGSSLVAASRSTKRRILIFAWCSCAALTLAISLNPALEEWRAYREHSRRFPILGDFEKNSDLHFWIANQCSPKECTLLSFSDEHSALGGRSLHIVGTTGRFGLTFNAGDRDWSEYEVLEFSIFTESEFDLLVRIDDDKDCTEFDSRFNARYQLSTGNNILQIPIKDIERGPKTRNLAINNVRRMMLFNLEPSRMDFYLDKVQLAKNGSVSMQR